MAGDRIASTLADDARWHARLAALLAASGKFESAASHYRRALRGLEETTGGAPEDDAQRQRRRLQWQFELAATETKRGRRQDAIVLYEGILQVDSECVEAQVNLAAQLAIADASRLEEALELCMRALTLRPDLAEAHYNRNMLLRRLGRQEEAVNTYWECLARDLGDGVVRASMPDTLARVLLPLDGQNSIPKADKACNNATGDGLGNQEGGGDGVTVVCVKWGTNHLFVLTSPLCGKRPSFTSSERNVNWSGSQIDSVGGYGPRTRRQQDLAPAASLFGATAAEPTPRPAASVKLETEQEAAVLLPKTSLDKPTLGEDGSIGAAQRARMELSGSRAGPRANSWENVLVNNSSGYGEEKNDLQSGPSTFNNAASRSSPLECKGRRPVSESETAHRSGADSLFEASELERSMQDLRGADTHRILALEDHWENVVHGQHSVYGDMSKNEYILTKSARVN
ncbi:hypothetical protein KRP22_005277 [Phytophthora ramorum]|nr:hypothetical protein KRP22_12862 [Phytophthora ramorum]